ncbi:C2 calcium lipid binding region, CaLB [Echinococcus multilocularis]|uniref:C2 calcium lipid binding region, CaLB n=1 Tax=Echinococcus multilocularis TaxID=6211 RepID=A0A068Y185_ECHMU|nr:C2 calcium lipid binding region, CaLB [Echinococcus multilocularis]
MSRLPRSVKIVVHDGRNLDYRVAGSKKSPQTRRWRVIFIGGEKKQATGIVDEQDGFPRWDCEVLIVTPKPVNSVRMLVVDGKEREVGQVVISLTELPWPPAPPPSLVTSQLHVRELQPTKHNPIPCGQLSFWVWVLDYWPEGTVPMAASGSTHSKHGTLRGSFKAQQHDFTMTPPTGDSHSRLGAKLRNMKNRVQGRGDNGSYVSSATRQSRLTEERQPQAEEGSVIMGTSILSSHPGLGPMGWATGASDLTGGILNGGGGGSESNLLSNGVAGRGIGAGTKSYNPLASQDEEDSGRMERKLGRTPSLFAGEASTTPTLNGRTGDGQNPVSTHGEGKSRRKVMVEHLRNKISRSSANISELGHKIRSRRSSPDGSRCEQECKVPLDEPKLSQSSSTPPPMRPEIRPIVKTAESRLEPNPRYAEAMVKEEWGLPATQALTSPLKPMPKRSSPGTTYGLHPEEGPGKSKDDMTKRELIELANLLEERLMSTRTEVVRLNMEQNQLNAQIAELNSDLCQTRTNLSALRNRLLEDNMTQYLEVSGGSPPRNTRSEHLTTFETAAVATPGPRMRSPGGSILSRARALASKSFGSVIGGATSQPNLTNPAMMSPRHSLSPPSPPTTRPGGIDYGMVLTSGCDISLQVSPCGLVFPPIQLNPFVFFG